jgi:hypothetical protein
VDFWPATLAGFVGGWLAFKPRWEPTPVHTDPHGHRTPPGPEWRAEHQPRQWPATAAGRAAFVRYAVPLFAAAAGLPQASAVLFVAHVARETGFGRAVWNNAWGNIKQYGPAAWPWHRLADQEPYKSFLTPQAGAAYAVRLVQQRWPGPYAKLRAGDATWYGDLGRGGYYEGDPAAAQQEYDTVFLPVVRRYA